MKEFPVRKKIRLQGYDYSSNGAYFVTFCVENKHELLGKIVGSGFHARPTANTNIIGSDFQCPVGHENHARPTVELTEIGIEIQKSIEFMCKNNPKIKIPKYIIMPNHVHMIVVLSTVRQRGDTVGHGSPTLQSVVGRIKSYTAKCWCDIYGLEHQSFWQSRFHDHIIRNKEEYERICQYIDENPLKWAEDSYFVE
ncbi:MAG: transposase [Oscillospiraceae bacterium]|nr:transposase [Oscillospiraceae bacterium]